MSKKRLVALAIALVAFVGTAYAASVDINLTPLFGSDANGGQWSWCSGSSCNKVIYVKVKNLGGVATISHVYVGAFDDEGNSCPLSVPHAYKVSCSNGASLGELEQADVSGQYVSTSGFVWPNARRLQQRSLSANGELCYRIDVGFETPPGHAGYAGCYYTVEVQPASYDTDTDDSEHYNPYVHHGRTSTWEML